MCNQSKRKQLKEVRTANNGDGKSMYATMTGFFDSLPDIDLFPWDDAITILRPPASQDDETYVFTWRKWFTRNTQRNCVRVRVWLE